MESIFESEHISFVPVSERMVHDYLKMVNDIENVGRYIGSKEGYSLEEELDFIRERLEANAPIFSMVEKSSGEFIGNIEFMDVKDSCGELGIAITADKQNKNYGSEAIGRMLTYGFEKLDLKRVFLKVYPENTRAIHVYEKCGFKAYDEKDDDIFMEILREA